MFDRELLALSKKLKQEIVGSLSSTSPLSCRPFYIATAESCSGGMLGAAITATPGSSAYYKQGFITYSNESKIELLNVRQDILDLYGAVSMETAKAMAEGCVLAAQSDIGVSITGIAGPGGGSSDKPVGLVCIGLSVVENKHQPSTQVESNNIVTYARQYNFEGDRHSIRIQSCVKALEMLLTPV